tara:strand:+ start:538 stop:1197 length:660 start_codon:yes stop_codon:yes gene_type:complete
MGHASFSAQVATPEVVTLTDGDHPSFIGGYLLNDLSICDRLIEEHKKSSAVIRGHVVKMNTASKGTELEEITQKRKIDLTLKDSYDLGFCDLPSLLSQEYFTALQYCLEVYKSQYVFANQCERYGIEGGQVQMYQKGGGFFNYHAETNGMSTCKRNLVFMTYLNDVEDGGETDFFYQNLKVKPRKGLTLIWPSGWTHTHKGIPSMTEEKYIITGWYHYC